VKQVSLCPSCDLLAASSTERSFKWPTIFASFQPCPHAPYIDVKACDCCR